MYINWVVGIIIVISILLIIQFKHASSENMTKIRRGVGFLNTGDEIPVAAGIVNSGVIPDYTYTYFDGSGMESCDLCPNSSVCPSCPQFRSEHMSSGNITSTNLSTDLQCMMSKIKDSLPMQTILDAKSRLGSIVDGKSPENMSPELQAISLARQRLMNPNAVIESRDHFVPVGIPGLLATHTSGPKLSMEQQAINMAGNTKNNEYFVPVGIPGLLGRSSKTSKVSDEMYAIRAAGVTRHHGDAEFMYASYDGLDSATDKNLSITGGNASIGAGHRAYFPQPGMFQERIPNSELDARIYAPNKACSQHYERRVNDLLYGDIMHLDINASPADDYCETWGLNGYSYSEPCNMKEILDNQCQIMAARSSSNRK